MQAIGQQKVAQSLHMSENSLTLVLQKKTRKILTPGKGKQKTEKFTPFGGNYFTNRAFNALSLGKVINETLGKRSSTYNGYQWDEIVSSLLDVYLCGGNCVEDVNRKECHQGACLREHKLRIPFGKEIRVQRQPETERTADKTQHEDGAVQRRPDRQCGFRPRFYQSGEG